MLMSLIELDLMLSIAGFVLILGVVGLGVMGVATYVFGVTAFWIAVAVGIAWRSLVFLVLAVLPIGLVRLVGTYVPIQTTAILLILAFIVALPFAGWVTYLLGWSDKIVRDCLGMVALVGLPAIVLLGPGAWLWPEHLAAWFWRALAATIGVTLFAFFYSWATEPPEGPGDMFASHSGR
jgi:hypothetical protein